MVVAVIVQARMGSTRLPGKVMMDLEGRPVLHHVLERCRAIPGVDTVVCAMPDGPTSDPLEAVAVTCGVDCFRGSEYDVLNRYLGAANAAGADTIIRVTSDCPLIDPVVCGKVLGLLQRECAHYASNNMPGSFPHGLDCEAFTMATLREADATARDPHQREHVTPWMRTAPHLARVNLASGEPDLRELRWTLDYPEDILFFRAVFARLPANHVATTREVLEVMAANPAIAEINASRRMA